MNSCDADDTAEVATGVAEAVLEPCMQPPQVYSVSSWINERFLQSWLNATLCATQSFDDVVEFGPIFSVYQAETRSLITKHEFVCAVARLLRMAGTKSPCTCNVYKETHLHGYTLYIEGAI
jgi:hypothetical protein